jgi:RHS repeat-associated protein
LKRADPPLHDYADDTSGQYAYEAVFAAVNPFTDRSGHATRYAIDSGSGNVTGTRDRNSNLTQFQYDIANRQTVVIDPLGHTATTYYDNAGNVTGTRDPNGNLTQYLIDALGRASVTIDPLSNRTTTLFDPAGEVTGVLDGRGKLTQFARDGDGRVTVTTDPLGHTQSTAYDGNGRVTASTDGNGHQTQYVYDAAGRLTVTIDPLTHRTTRAYDAAGNLTSLTDASGNSTAFAYNAANQLTQQTDPLGHSSTFAYDGVGQLTGTTDRLGRTVSYAYDGAGRLTGQTWRTSGGVVSDTRSFSYDGDGQVLTAANSQGTYTYTYDAAGRVTTVAEPFSVALTFSYDNNGNRTLVQDSLGGVTTSVYDGDNNLTSRRLGGTGVTAQRIDQTYNADNQLSTQTRYSDLAGTTVVATTSFTYDDAGRLTDEQHKDGLGNNIAHFTYTYDSADQLLTEATDGTVTNYSYDAAGEVTADSTGSYSYDATGNRTMAGYSTSTGNQLSSDGTYNYVYDAEGNQTQKSKGLYADTWEYTYDGANRLITAKEWNAQAGPPRQLLQEVDYKYDAYGNVLEKDVDSNGDGVIDSVQRDAYDAWDPAKPAPVGNENWDVLAELDGNNHLTTRYLRGDVVDQVFGRQNASGLVYWTLTDRLGSARDVTDASGVVKDKLAYDGYGNITSETNATYRGLYTWAGRVYEKETGLYDLRARRYDPKTGRFLGQDPKGFDAGDSNLYRYVKNGPTDATDPSGLDENSVGSGISTVAPREPRKLTVQEAIELETRDYQRQAKFLMGAPPPRPLEVRKQVASPVASPLLSKHQRAHYETVESELKQKYEQGQLTPQEQRLYSYTNYVLAQDRLWQVYSSPPPPPEPKVILSPQPMLGSVNYDSLRPPLVDVQRSDPSSADGNYEKRHGDWPSNPGVPECLMSGLEFLGNAAQVTIGVMLILGGHPLAGGYALYRGAEALFSQATGTPRIATQVAGAVVGEVGAQGAEIAGIVGDFFAVPKGPGAVNLRATGSRVGAPLRQGFEGAASMAPLGPYAPTGNGVPLAQSGPRFAAGGAARPFAWLTLHMVYPPYCFVAGTPLLTPDGDKPIEAFREGDWILSRAEDDPVGPVEARRVEAVFVRVAPLWVLRVGGRVIRTTAEHPFYVRGKGWIAAKELEAGMELASHDGQWVVLEEVADAGEVATVYNLRISEFHTYFVGSREWGFSVWAHNDCTLRTGELEALGAEYARRINAQAARMRGAGSTADVELSLAAGGWDEIAALRSGRLRGTLSDADKSVIRAYVANSETLLNEGVSIRIPSPTGRNGNPAHVADVTANNTQASGELRAIPVGGRVPDGVGRTGQRVLIRGVPIDPGPNGRVIVESERFSGNIPVSGGRAQLRDIRRGDRGATIVVTDPENPARAPLIYPPGTQPPPSGHYRGGRTHVPAARE